MQIHHPYRNHQDFGVHPKDIPHHFTHHTSTIAHQCVSMSYWNFQGFRECSRESISFSITIAAIPRTFGKTARSSLRIPRQTEAHYNIISNIPRTPRSPKVIFPTFIQDPSRKQEVNRSSKVAKALKNHQSSNIGLKPQWS